MTYEGWANYQTWNVSLWINNEERLYRAAVYYVKKAKHPTYEHFISQAMPATYGDLTPDGVSWTDPTLDHEALDAMILELKETG